MIVQPLFLPSAVPFTVFISSITVLPLGIAPMTCAEKSLIEVFISVIPLYLDRLQSELVKTPVSLVVLQ